MLPEAEGKPEIVWIGGYPHVKGVNVPIEKKVPWWIQYPWADSIEEVWEEQDIPDDD
jgi:hypothetical protein